MCPPDFSQKFPNSGKMTARILKKQPKTRTLSGEPEQQKRAVPNAFDAAVQQSSDKTKRTQLPEEQRSVADEGPIVTRGGFLRTQAVFAQLWLMDGEVVHDKSDEMGRASSTLPSPNPQQNKKSEVPKKARFSKMRLHLIHDDYDRRGLFQGMDLHVYEAS